MDSEDAPASGAAAPRRGYVRFSAKVAREVCWRTAAGESQLEICADPAMPCVDSVNRWARQHGRFARAYARARALGGRGATGRGSSFCPVAANEIVARISEGEMLPSITADAHMPSLRTLYRWRVAHPDFDEEIIQARAALAERFSALGWKLAMEATPETAYLTHVRLGQLRWTAAVLGPRTYGRLKPTEPPAPPEVHTVCYRHFKIEEHPETGQHRVVGYTPDPETLLPERTSEGEWKDPIWTVRSPQGHWTHTRQKPGPGVEVWEDRPRRAGSGNAAPAAPEGEGESKPDDPEGWC